MDIQQIAERLRATHPHAVLSVDAEAPTPWIGIAAERMTDVALTLRDDPALDFDRLLFVAGIDHEGYDESGKGKHRAIAQYGEDGKVADAGPAGTADLGVSYFLQSRAHMHTVVLKVRVPRDEPRVHSIARVYPTADWGERETFDMYGIEFVGHPDPRRILLPEDWEGWPLRKDYPMPARYHDVPLEGLPLAVRAKQEVAPPADAAGDGDGATPAAGARPATESRADASETPDGNGGAR